MRSTQFSAMIWSNPKCQRCTLRWTLGERRVIKAWHGLSFIVDEAFRHRVGDGNAQNKIAQTFLFHVLVFDLHLLRPQIVSCKDGMWVGILLFFLKKITLKAPILCWVLLSPTCAFWIWNTILWRRDWFCFLLGLLDSERPPLSAA